MTPAAAAVVVVVVVVVVDLVSVFFLSSTAQRNVDGIHWPEK